MKRKDSNRLAYLLIAVMFAAIAIVVIFVMKSGRAPAPMTDTENSASQMGNYIQASS